jgi:hypothetical protein
MSHLNLSPKIHLLVPLFAGSYVKKVLQADYANLIGYWPMNEASGGVAVDRSAEGNDGAYTGVDLANGPGPDAKPCPWWDGANDYNDIYSVGFDGDFDGGEGTFAVWCKVNAVGVWTDAATHYVCRIFVDANNNIFIAKPAVNNRIQFIYKASGTSEQHNSDAHTETDWIHMAMTWSASAGANGEVNYYVDGAPEAVDTDLGAWAGALDNASCVIGNQSHGSPNTWHGWLAHGAVWKVPLSAATIAKLAVI